MRVISFCEADFQWVEYVSVMDFVCKILRPGKGNITQKDPCGSFVIVIS